MSGQSKNINRETCELATEFLALEQLIVISDPGPAKQPTVHIPFLLPNVSLFASAKPTIYPARIS